MNYLIDTHILLWHLELNPQLSSKAKDIIEEENNQIYLSIVSLWEIAIKLSVGKLILNSSLEQIIKEIEDQNISILPISTEALILVRDLDFHHKDPFDRIIICEAIHKSLIIVTDDSQFSKYPVNIIS